MYIHNKQIPKVESSFFQPPRIEITCHLLKLSHTDETYFIIAMKLDVFEWIGPSTQLVNVCFYKTLIDTTQCKVVDFRGKNAFDHISL